MATLTVNEVQYELKTGIILDKLLNKAIKEYDENGKELANDKVSGGMSKILPLLIEQDITGLIQLWEVYIKSKGGKATYDEIAEAIEERMDELKEAKAVYNEVFEAIDESAFSRNEFSKFKGNMLMASLMKQKDEDKKAQMEMMIERLSDNYKEITGKALFPAKAKKA